MSIESPVFVAGHRGLVGSAIQRSLHAQGYDRILVRDRAELNLVDQAAVSRFFETERPRTVFLAAARVGGIRANSTYPAEFVRDNLVIQSNVIHSAWASGVQQLFFLGSSCIYPRLAPQPMSEACLLTGPLEATNRPYAVAKIAGIEMCWSYNRQYGTRYIAVMPTNLYGPGDNYDLDNSHVLPALIRKMHEAKIKGDAEVTVWGTGTPRRELLYSDDLADAVVHLAQLEARALEGFFNHDAPPLLNIGVGADITIRELAELAADVVGFHGRLVQDPTRPDGTPQKLLDVGRISALGWRARTSLREGIGLAYRDFLERHVGS